MNGSDRHNLRATLDARVRERIAAFDQDAPVARCAGCGANHQERTSDCKVCWERHYKRQRRQDVAFREREAYQQRLSRHLHGRKSRAKA